jgi:hypothetical protein
VTFTRAGSGAAPTNNVSAQFVILLQEQSSRDPYCGRVVRAFRDRLLGAAIAARSGPPHAYHQLLLPESAVSVLFLKLILSPNFAS